MYLQNLFSKLPTKFISNREFCYLIAPEYWPEHFSPETADGWIHHRSGIRTRAYFNPENPGCGSLPPEIEVGHAVEALKPKINPAAWEEIDAIISIRSSPHHFIPNLSQRVLRELNGIFGAECKKFTLDLLQPSTGVLNALVLLRNSSFKRVLVLVSEILSPLLNLKDPGTAMLFGDAVAGFEITPELTPASQFKILGESFLALADHHELLSGDSHPESFHMKGPELFRKVIPEFKRSSLDLLQALSIPLSQVSYYLPHQANQRMIERAAHAIGFAHEQIISNVARVGNLSNASTLVALSEFYSASPPHPKQLILLNACGAGLSSGAALLEAV